MVTNTLLINIGFNGLYSDARAFVSAVCTCKQKYKLDIYYANGLVTYYNGIASPAALCVLWGFA